MIDCHCHICDYEFDKDREEVVERAKNAGVRAVLANTEGVDEFDKCLQLSEKFADFILVCVGVHPVQYESRETFQARSAKRDDLLGMDDWLAKNHKKIIALGETGLDFAPRYIRTEDDKQSQKDVLKHQLDLALKYNVPIICHSRSAGKPTLEFLIANGARNVLMHAFDGNAKSAQAGIDAGYYFSIPPSSIRSDQKQKLLEKLPLSQILLETDSPVLGPDKDSRNEPANLRISCEVVAKIKKVSVDDVQRITTENALRLFPRLRRFLQI